VITEEISLPSQYGVYLSCRKSAKLIFISTVMAANLEDQLIDKVRVLPPNKQQEALRLLDTLASGASSEPSGTAIARRPIWEVVDEINAELPADTWENVPTDSSINLDHYLYGARSSSRESCIP
jgi:hypothetical protein